MGTFKKGLLVKLAETCNVSKNTIGRDVKASETAGAIGEASHRAKRMILSGGIKIDMKALAAAIKPSLKKGDGSAFHLLRQAILSIQRYTDCLKRYCSVGHNR